MFTTYLFFALVAVVALSLIGMYFLKSPYNFPQTCLYIVNLCFTKLLWRVSFASEFPVPRDQGVVLFSNHRSSVDPCFLQVNANRVVHWLVADDFGSRPLLKSFLKFVQVIDVGRRGQDTAATKKAIRFVQEGRAVGIFPEGRINMSDEFMTPIRPGAIIIALKGRVPIVPVYIEGSKYGGKPLSPLFMMAKVTVHYGKPIDLSPFYGSKDLRHSMGEIAVQCAKEIAKLAGRTDFEPKVAGRRWRPSDEEVAKLNQEAGKR